MLGLGSGISSMISTLVALVLYDMAGLVLANGLRCDSCQLTLCHAARCFQRHSNPLRSYRVRIATGYSCSNP